jgi:class 3 adenylate cyclase/CHASE2 domain-containing sensor protein
MAPRPRRNAALGALLLAVATLLPLLLVRPPSPLAAAEGLIRAAAFHLIAPAQPQSPDIAVIAITDDTLAALAYRSPIDRAFLANLIDTLAASGPRAIGLDVVLDQATEPDKDDALRAALDRAAIPVVIASIARDSPLDPARRGYLDQMLSGRRAGYVNLARDRFDAQIREHEPVRRPSGERSFTTELALAVGATAPERDFAIAWRHRAPEGAPFPVYPAEAAAQLPRSWLEGRILLIGTLIPGIDEHRALISAFGPPAHGVEIHAHILSQILEGRAARASVFPAGAAVTAAMAASGMGLALWLGGWTMVGGMVGVGLLLWILAFAVFAAGGPLVPVLAPTLGLVLASGGVRFWRGRQEQRDRQMLMQLFSRFVGGPVLDQILSEREVLLAGGRPRPQELTATVLFSDIAGFTAVCERLEPAPLIAWLDRYFDTMVQPVFAHGGIVLRFIGDGILCVFGAPLPRRSEAEIAADATNAVRCALDMKRTMDMLNGEWRAAGLPGAGLRIGIYTGPLVAGSIGSGPHMEYSILGDTVNIAARLEALGKSFASGAIDDCVILAGEPTWNRLDGACRGEPVGEVILRGKTQKVAVYRIDTFDPEASQTAVASHRDALRSVAAR